MAGQDVRIPIVEHEYKHDQQLDHRQYKSDKPSSGGHVLSSEFNTHKTQGDTYSIVVQMVRIYSGFRSSPFLPTLDQVMVLQSSCYSLGLFEEGHFQGVQLSSRSLYSTIEYSTRALWIRLSGKKKNAKGIRTCTLSSGPPAQLVWVPILLKIGTIS